MLKRCTCKAKHNTDTYTTCMYRLTYELHSGTSVCTRETCCKPGTSDGSIAGFDSASSSISDNPVSYHRPEISKTPRLYVQPYNNCQHIIDRPADKCWSLSMSAEPLPSTGLQAMSQDPATRGNQTSAKCCLKQTLGESSSIHTHPLCDNG